MLIAVPTALGVYYLATSRDASRLFNDRQRAFVDEMNRRVEAEVQQALEAAGQDGLAHTYWEVLVAPSTVQALRPVTLPAGIYRVQALPDAALVVEALSDSGWQRCDPDSGSLSHPHFVPGLGARLLTRAEIELLEIEVSNREAGLERARQADIDFINGTS